MTRVLTESPVPLESLDDHMKALLRLKLREFVHLSPWFKNIPSIDPLLYSNSYQPRQNQYRTQAMPDTQCPNRKPVAPAARRHARQAVNVHGIY